MEGGGGKILGTYDHNILGPIYDEGAQEDICTARLIPQISAENLSEIPQLLGCMV